MDATIVVHKTESGARYFTVALPEGSLVVKTHTVNGRTVKVMTWHNAIARLGPMGNLLVLDPKGQTLAHSTRVVSSQHYVAQAGEFVTAIRDVNISDLTKWWGPRL